MLDEESIEDIFEDEGYENIIKFLMELGVSKHLRLKSKGWFYCFDKEYMKQLEEEHGITQSSRYIVDYSFPMFYERMASMTKDSSLEIWNSVLSIIENDKNFPFALYSRHGKYDRFISGLLWSLINKPWLYSRSGDVFVPSQLMVTELDEQYDTTSPQAISLISLLKLKTEMMTADDAMEEARKLCTDEEIVRLLKELIREKQSVDLGMPEEDIEKRKYAPITGNNNGELVDNQPSDEQSKPNSGLWGAIKRLFGK